MIHKKYKFLSDEQVEHFLNKGWVRIVGAFKKEQAEDFTADLWIRLGLDPNDKSNWPNHRLHLPMLRSVKTKEFSPKAWGAMCELLGGEDRIEPNSGIWGDSFIINLGSSEDEAEPTPPRELDNWHCDGDFFLHFLDSPEQGLLVIPVFSKILPGGGGTFISPDGVDSIAKMLAAHPEGIRPGVGPGPDKFDFMEHVSRCNEFVEMTGDVGDCILMHPLMLHSASQNLLRIPRIITNPPVSLREPFNFNRENRDDFSLVELKTLRAVGVDRLDYKPTVPRERIIPARKKAKDNLKVIELERLKQHAIDSGKPIPDICVM